VTLEEARKRRADAEAAWSARSWETIRWQQIREARAVLALSQCEAEGKGQLSLEDAEPPAEGGRAAGPRWPRAKDAP
jgi:hypothetical protein